ncbi:MAG: hypothetical protein WAM30_08300, partial [Candidatus Dormiibacterota bacterium]
SGPLTIHEGDPDSAVLVACCVEAPRPVWGDVGGRLLSGGWRVQMQIAEWLPDAIPPDVIVDRVGADLRRARFAASILRVRGERAPVVVRKLLEGFGDDDQVAGALRGRLLSGFWTGHESDRLAGQIEDLKSWRASSEPEAVRKWTVHTIDELERRRLAVLSFEAEERS